MTPGVLRKSLSDGDLTATISPDGWESDDADFLRHLKTCYPPPPTEAGTPWVIAFWQAAEGLGADVTQEPEPDPYPPTGEE